MTISAPFAIKRHPMKRLLYLLLAAFCLSVFVPEVEAATSGTASVVQVKAKKKHRKKHRKHRKKHRKHRKKTATTTPSQPATKKK